MKPPLFKFSVLTLALVAGYAHADDAPVEQKQELQNITVKADTSTRRVTTKKMDESTSTDMKDVLFNEPSINFAVAMPLRNGCPFAAWGKTKLI